MKLDEAKEILKKNGYRLNEAEWDGKQETYGKYLNGLNEYTEEIEDKLMEIGLSEELVKTLTQDCEVFEELIEMWYNEDKSTDDFVIKMIDHCLTKYFIEKDED